MMIVTCLNRYLGRCPKCKRDYDPEHHPNNLDCREYESLSLSIRDVGGNHDASRTGSNVAR